MIKASELSKNAQRKIRDMELSNGDVNLVVWAKRRGRGYTLKTMPEDWSLEDGWLLVEIDIELDDGLGLL